MKERNVILAFLYVLFSCGREKTGALNDIIAEPETLEVSADLSIEMEEVMDYGFEEKVGEELEEGEVIERPQEFCNDNNDCLSGWCVETPNDKVCTKICSLDSTCPAGWECVQVQSKPDVVYVCVHPAPRECIPCEEDGDCEVSYASAKMRCVSVGGYYRCLKECMEKGCGDGYECKEIDGGKVKACVLEGGCECTKVGEGKKGRCELKSEYGVCYGEYRCEGGEATGCKGEEAKAEVCNGHDDDCDGEVDEGIGESECELKNDYGICKGKGKCGGRGYM